MTNEQRSVVTDELREVNDRWKTYPYPHDRHGQGMKERDAHKLADAADTMIAEIDRLRAENDRLAVYEKLHSHALDCVDQVFTIDFYKPRPLLPDFCKVGDDKFEAVIELAIAYIAKSVELDHLEAENSQLREQVEPQQPDGPITEELCRTLGLRLEGSTYHYWRLDVPLENDDCGVLEQIVTVHVNTRSVIVRSDGFILPGPWTANRLRKLVEAMRGE